jgi:hypothetical protein
LESGAQFAVTVGWFHARAVIENANTRIVAKIIATPNLVFFIFRPLLRPFSKERNFFSRYVKEWGKLSRAELYAKDGNYVN